MKIGIIGLGLIGGTIAKCLNSYHEISAYDISDETLNYAMNNQIINRAYNNIEDFLKDNTVIYLCLYPNDIKSFFEKNKSLFKDNSVFIEISGVKQKIVEEVEKLNLNKIDIIYTHPVAGSEKIGVQHAKSSIFKNANYIITPVESNKKENLELAKKLAHEMGFKNISNLTPKQHDDIIAYTSQLTHIISLSLVNSIDTNLDTNKFIGDSYKDLTRIANINEELWSNLFLQNRESLLTKIDNFKESINEFEKAIKDNDQIKLKKLLLEAKKIKENIDKG